MASAVLVAMVTAQPSVRSIEIAEGDPTQESLEWGWQVNRVVVA